MPFLATKYKDMSAISPDGMSFFGNTRCLIWAVLLTGIVHLGAAQTQTYRGVVWDPPTDPVQAEATMRQMHAMGVNAIRMPLLRDERLLTLADTLGLHLFQELPLDYLSAEALRDTLGYATRLLELVLNDARAHPSVRHIGLARHSDTSDSTACAFFEQLTRRVREQGPEGSQTFYLTSFTDADRCADAVDLVLLDVRDAEAPLAALAGWQGPVGIGALGTWVSRKGEGVRRAHTAEAQARYLETHLGALLEAPGSLATAVFVYRWRDKQTARPDLRADITSPYHHRYGLFDASGTARPAAAVVEGIYTGAQAVFALPTGAPPAPSAVWSVLMGWGVVILLGVSYAVSPRLRFMAPRFFIAPGFYRESIREGRDIILWTSVTMLVVMALSVGVWGTLLLEVLRHTEAFHVLYREVPLGLQTTGATLLAQPWLLVLLLGCIYALGVAVWATLLAVAARNRHPLVPGQVLMLVLWPTWPMLLLMVGAMVVRLLPPDDAVYGALGLLGAGILTALYAHARALFDYRNVTRASGALSLILAFASPFTLFLIIGGFSLLEVREQVSLVWHLFTRL